MAYDLDQFISDCRSALSRDPGPAGREQVRQNLERLLANKDFIEEFCGDNVPRGLKVLYEDSKLGFQILAHINDKARVSPPHESRLNSQASEESLALTSASDGLVCAVPSE